MHHAHRRAHARRAVVRGHQKLGAHRHRLLVARRPRGAARARPAARVGEAGHLARDGGGRARRLSRQVAVVAVAEMVLVAVAVVATAAVVRQ